MLNHSSYTYGDCVRDLSILPPISIRPLKHSKYQLVLKNSEDPETDSIVIKFIDKFNGWDQTVLKAASCFFTYFIIENTPQQVVLLQTKSVIQFLNISKKSLKLVAGSNQTENIKKILRQRIFIKQTESYSDDIRDLFRSAVLQYDFHDGQLIDKDDRRMTGIGTQEIEWAIKEANRNRYQLLGRNIKSYKYWRNPAEEKIAIVKKIGDGGYCDVYFYLDLETKMIGALKVANFKHNKIDTFNDLENEFNLLTHIHSYGNVWGIQAKPKQLIDLQIESYSHNRRKTKVKKGYVGIKYHNDYLTEILKETKPSLRTVLLEFHQLLGGLKVLSDLDITHGDIKLKNILVGNFKSFKWVHLSDFGGARRGDQDLPLDHFVAGDGRPSSYEGFLSEDLKKSNQCRLERNKEDLIKYEKLRDVYAMGCVLHFRLKGCHPYLHIKYICDEELDPNDFNGLDFDGELPELRDLIEWMIDRDLTKRATAAIAFNFLNYIIRTNFPDLAREIENLMKKNEFIMPL